MLRHNLYIVSGMALGLALQPACAQSQPTPAGQTGRGMVILPRLGVRAAAPNKTALNVTGVWTDSYGYNWILNQNDAGRINGSVTIAGCPVPTWSVTGAVTGSTTFTLNANDPDGGDDVCDASFQYKMTTVSAGSASGSWTSSAGGAGSVTMQLSYGLAITEPQNLSLYSFDRDTATSVRVQYEAEANLSSDNVAWTVSFTYEPEGMGAGPFSATDSFSSGLNTKTNRIYRSEGGQATVNASGDTAGSALSIQYFLAGGNITNAQITAQLTQLYAQSGLPTASLLCDIAVVESGYKQFSSNDLYDETALWPLESAANGGANVGLLQVNNSMDNAFNWKTNSSNGYNVFMNKVGAVNRYQAKAIAANPGLPSLTGIQVENSALSYYRGFSFHYYIVAKGGGAPSWIQNPSDTTVMSDGDTADGYVTKVRMAVVPN
jgi:hypothetical protein